MDFHLVLRFQHYDAVVIYDTLRRCLTFYGSAHSSPAPSFEMASSFWKGVVGVGLFALAHAAFSAAQHRSYMRLTEKEHETLPIDIVLQTLLSFVMTCYGIVHIAGEFKDMDASSELKNKTFDTLRNHPSFYLFNHRGRVLFHTPKEEPSSNQQALPNPIRLRKLEH
ncbi:ER membrane protein complex subunit 5 isoform X1 [Poecilia latipinna]|uniref:Membrane magnesium transporter n=3 Tax=Poecilia TaxID=8080 RepID=A0A087X5F1_POEFO|nr:PREDICTED: membrane magnesium transporter 1 [Poecilia formosa]XP_014898580.1 PREDICTED: membrane magnesium transporter 1 isoform X1 [Poecilia latipinna]